VAFTETVDVLGVPIYATNNTGDDKLTYGSEPPTIGVGR
jgi:hypothetical protein